MAKGRDASREIVVGLMDLPREAEGEARHEALRRLLTRRPSLSSDQPFLRDLLGLAQPADGDALYAAMDNAARQRGRAAAVVRLLGTACADAPVLVIVEDVHWADKVTLDYVAVTRG
jgi:predicted ATPase